MVQCVDQNNALIRPYQMPHGNFSSLNYIAPIPTGSRVVHLPIPNPGIETSISGLLSLFSTHLQAR